MDDAQIAAVLDVSPGAIDSLRDSDEAMTAPMLERISHIVAIYAALEQLLPGGRGAHWLRQPNDAAVGAGRPAVELLQGGRLDDLNALREYLDAEIYR